MIEHRKFPRLEYRNTALLVTRSGPVKTDIINISENGILMNCAYPMHFEKDDPVKIIFKDEETNDMCLTKARVVRCTENEKEGGEKIAITYGHSDSISKVIYHKQYGGLLDDLNNVLGHEA